MNTLYDVTQTVDYKTKFVNDDENLALYQEQIQSVFFYHSSLVPFSDVFKDKCDALYEFLNRENREFMDVLLEGVLDKSLSDSLYFYICCTTIKTLVIDNTVAFDVFKHLSNEDYRKLVFGYLFSFDCFQSFHVVLKKYFNTGAVKLDLDIKTLSSDLLKMF